MNTNFEEVAKKLKKAKYAVNKKGEGYFTVFTPKENVNAVLKNVAKFLRSKACEVTEQFFCDIGTEYSVTTKFFAAHLANMSGSYGISK